MSRSFSAVFNRWLVRSVRMATVLVFIGGSPTWLAGQERLVTRHSAGIGSSYERVSFGGNGLQQGNFIGLDSARITQVSQASTPVSLAWTFSDRWRADLTGLYSRASIQYRNGASIADTRSATLSGFSDLRLRGTGVMLHDVLVITAGLNIPTGRTSLSNDQFGVLRVAAAPALGMGSMPVGAGLSGTLGAVVGRKAGAWALAIGGSYELRGTYQPIAALVAGAPSIDYRPGEVLRLSVTGDRTVGAHRLSLAVAGDFFTDDVLHQPVLNASSGSSAIADRSVRLGPVISTDVQMVFSVPRLRQLVAYSSLRVRAPFLRDGEKVAESSGQYLDSGVRAAIALAPQRDLILGADSRLHTGLGVDQGLPTSGVASGSVSAGVEVRRGLLTAQPYVRAQHGSLRQRNTGASQLSQSFNGFGFGLVAVTRF